MVDSSVALDMFTADPVWSSWSLQQLDAAAARGPLLIDPVAYAELSVRFDTIEAVERAAGDLGLVLTTPPREALFAAGKAFGGYRARGGPRLSILPDFLIGAHASVLGVPLLTRDPKRLRAHFPQLDLITP